MSARAQRNADRLEAALSEQTALFQSGYSSSNLTPEQIEAARLAAIGTNNQGYVEKIEYFLAYGEWPKEVK